MTRERLKEIIDADVAGEQKPPGDDVYNGLTIMKKYLGDADLVKGADHDVVFGPSLDELAASGITEEDAVELRVLGWISDEHGEGVAHFV